ncbi:hypothetical protein PO124_11410 [Bacillus licheniformis]|nr:hypothetical protein [Bacillus licheniformis]
MSGISSFPAPRRAGNIEDQYFSFRCLLYANTAAFVTKPLYHYRVHLSSIVQSIRQGCLKTVSLFMKQTWTA